jgi:chaperonin GroEL
VTQVLTCVVLCVCSLCAPSSLLPPCSKVIRCALENACSVAKTFLLADVVVTEIPERNPAAAAAGGGDDYGY